MSGGAEMVAGAVVQHLAGMLGDKAWERVELLWNFKDDVKATESIMIDLKVELSYADKRSRESADDEEVQHWLKKYKSVAYDIEDALDEMVADATIWENSKCTVKLFFSSINPLIVRITMSSKMKNIRMKLDKIVEDKKKFPLQQLMPTTTSQYGNKNRNETFIGDRDEIKMVGRGKEKINILNKMLQKYRHQESSIIPIVGLGGMGKTTLAKVVYTDKETNIFDVKAWVHVSMDFDLSKIVSAIISQVENSTPVNNVELQYLKSQLDRIFRDKFYLIVLDDLWEEGRSELENLINMLQSGKKGSSIIVTTRSEKIASTLSTIDASYFHIVDPVKLEGLSNDECWSIMKPQNTGSDLPSDLEDIGKEIAYRCSGVPLVAKALGFVMQKYCTKEEWSDIKKSNILDIKEDDKGILKGLLLSYYHMPSELKLCFMYCSVFPKSHNIDHDCLIQQWIALGFIQDTNGRQPLQKIGMEYVNELLGMSFLTNLTPKGMASRIFEPTLRLRMHDLVHDLARHVAGYEFFGTDSAANSNTKMDKLSCHYQLLMNPKEVALSYKSLPTKVRAMHFRECHKLQLHKKTFSRTLYLRVLDLSGCHVPELPVSVYKLKLLRYLDASTLPISNLSKSLDHLLNLQTLIFSNTSLKTLPTNIDCLQKLQYFDLSGCVSLCELPISFGNLKALVFLNLASCHELHTLPESFGNLKALVFLNLASCHELHTLPESFGGLHRLQFLNLSNCYKLRSLPESSCQLHGLVHLDLSDCHDLEKLPDCIHQFSKLEYLNMTSCTKVQMLPDSLCKLTLLKHLDLSFCVKLEHLPSSIGDLKLQSVNLEGCFFLGDLPYSIFSMSTLVYVPMAGLSFQIQSKIKKLREKLGLRMGVVDGGSGDLWGQIVKLENTPYHELYIKGLENIRHLEGAEQAKILNNSNLTWLSLIWGHDKGSLVGHAGAMADKSVLEKLVPPRSLQVLGLVGYMSVEFPRWMLDIASYLPHLTSIVLSELKGCSQLPPLGRLPNLRALALSDMPDIKRVDREFYGDYGSCQKLRMIILRGMANLELWCTTRSSTEEGEFLIPNLHFLGAIECPKLKFLPWPPRSMVWVLVNSDHVLPEHGFGNLSSSTSPFFLMIGDTSVSSEVWRRMHHLSSIECLLLASLTGIKTLPDAIGCFKSLRTLEIESCADLETLPEWLGDFTSLREIRIENSLKISSLPEGIRGLTELKKLRIIDCPELLEKCRGEDRHKIAHIPEVTSV